jgi:hypothetical protein
MSRKSLIECVLNKLLQEKLNAALAPKCVGINYDIVVILNKMCSFTIKVRSETIDSESKNNSIDITDKYDFLVIVVDDNGVTKNLILSKNDVNKEKGNNKKLSLSNKDGLLPDINQYKDNWDSIKNFSCN